MTSTGNRSDYRTYNCILLPVIFAIFSLVLATTSAQCTDPKFRLASYYSSNMVLQRPPARPRLWGYAINTGDLVVVTLNKGAQTIKSTATIGPDKVPIWEAVFNPISDVGPHVITVQSGSCVYNLTNILIGDVWICSGQSNMQFQMAQIDNPDEAIKDAVNYPNVRTFFAELEWSDTPLSDLKAVHRGWALPTAGDFSSISSRKPISKDQRLFWSSRMSSRRTARDVTGAEVRQEMKKSSGAFGSEGEAWRWKEISQRTTAGASNIAEFSAVCWLFGRNLYKKFGRPVGLIETNWGGTRIEAWSSPDALKQCFTTVPPQGAPNGASQLYNAMIHPFLPMPIFGGIWYQGEANENNPQFYGCAIKAMVSDWRSRWHALSPEMNDTFPFGQCQLAPYENQDIIVGFPDVRWGQTDSFGYVPNSNMTNHFIATTIDLPDFNSPAGAIHPRFKRQVADRLALAAYNVAYGAQDTGIYQGPIPVSIATDPNNNIRVTYNVELIHRFSKPNNFELCCSSTPTTTCTGAAGAHWVLTIPVDKTSQYVALNNTCNVGESVTGFRYLWRESPCDFETCPVYSAENSLPAPPFKYTTTKGLSTVNDVAGGFFSNPLSAIVNAISPAFERVRSWLSSMFETAVEN